MFYTHIIQKCTSEKMIALLIDPDKHTDASLEHVVDIANRSGIDFFLIGGSLVSKSVNDTIIFIKKLSSLKIFLFPGNLFQLCDQADGILLLSLISGRNPEFLIGNHVLAAPFLKNSGIEVISTSYILIGNGKTTSVEYISNTRHIPSGKTDIAVATAMAGEMLGHKLIYLEGGSGADKPVDKVLIGEVKKNISVPLIVGGGIRTPQQARDAFDAGANILVIGTIAEETPECLWEFSKTKTSAVI